MKQRSIQRYLIRLRLEERRPRKQLAQQGPPKRKKEPGQLERRMLLMKQLEEQRRPRWPLSAIPSSWSAPREEGRRRILLRHPLVLCLLLPVRLPLLLRRLLLRWLLLRWLLPPNLGQN